jgi:DNA polymerase III epsilon subunit-like protein
MPITDVDPCQRRAAAATRFARAMLEPGRAVIVDTESVCMGGPICEIAVIDAASGATLLDTLVNPGVPVTPAATAVHGLADAEVTAPGINRWPAAYRQLLEITHGRVILAYNADYDRAVITTDCARYGFHNTPLAAAEHWADVMAPRADHCRSTRWLPNGGAHRALADAQQTRRHLQRMTPRHETGRRQ